MLSAAQVERFSFFTPRMPHGGLAVERDFPSATCSRHCGGQRVGDALVRASCEVEIGILVNWDRTVATRFARNEVSCRLPLLHRFLGVLRVTPLASLNPDLAQCTASSLTGLFAVSTPCAVNTGIAGVMTARCPSSLVAKLALRM